MGPNRLRSKSRQSFIPSEGLREDSRPCFSIFGMPSAFPGSLPLSSILKTRNTRPSPSHKAICLTVTLLLLTSIFIFIYLFIFAFLFYLFIYLFLFVVNFVIHQNETAMGLHVFPIPIPPPTSLSTCSPQVFPVHQVQALVSCIQPGLVICFTLDNIHVSMLFS